MTPNISTATVPLIGLHELPTNVISKEISEFPWKNPGMSDPLTREKYLTVDQERASENVNAFLVLTGKLESPKSVLDVGCGSGNSTKHIYEKCRDNSYVVGVDIKENIDFASGYHLPDPQKNKQLSYFAVTSPLELPLNGGKGWDLITCFALFSWIPLEKQGEVLKHLYTRLIEGGEILIRTQACSERLYRVAVKQIMQTEEWRMFFTDYEAPYVDQTPEGFKKILEEAGFSNIQITFKKETFYFPNKQSIKKYFLQWLPPLSELKGCSSFETRTLREQFTADVIERYCQIIRSDGTDIPLTLPCLLVTACKEQQKLPGYATRI